MKIEQLYKTIYAHIKDLNTPHLLTPMIKYDEARNLRLVLLGARHNVVSSHTIEEMLELPEQSIRDIVEVMVSKLQE